MQVSSQLLRSSLTSERSAPIRQALKLWRTSILLSIVGLAGGLGNFAFQGMIARHLEKSEWGYVSSTLAFVSFLGLPLAIVSTALVHYIAHFQAANDEARLQGLLAGSRNFLLKITFAVSLLAALLLHPLSQFFHFPRSSLMLVAFSCVLLGLWSGFATTLFQGMAWFKRMALVGLVAVAMRLAFGWIMTSKYPTAEMAVSATTFSLLANLALFYWWKDIFKGGVQISPWNAEFFNYLLITTAFVGGTYFFTQGDLLVAQRYFGNNMGSYTAAGLLGRALTMVVAPFLTVLFTSRSGHKSGQAVIDQKILLVLYAAGLTLGSLVLILFRELLVKLIFGKTDPQAAQMVGPFGVTMVFIGLIQAIGTWALASRRHKLTILYGALGVAYWLGLLAIGKEPNQLLTVMPIGGGVAFVILCAAWLLPLRRESQEYPSC